MSGAPGEGPKTSPTKPSPESSLPVSEVAQIESPIIRKGEGGTKVSLTANYVRLEVEKGKGVFEYEVGFSPPVDSKNERFKCLNQHCNIIGSTKMFDGVVLYLPFQLPGFVTSVNECEDGIMLCCDVSHCVLHTQSVRDHLVNIHKMGEDNFNYYANARKALIGSKVVTKHNYRCYKINDIDFDATPNSKCTNSKFIDINGNEVSFAEYYKLQFNIDIKDPRQPMLVHRVSKKAQEKQGVNKIDLIYLVPELTFMTVTSEEMYDTHFMWTDDNMAMKDVEKYTTLTPNQGQLSLKKFIENVTSSEEASAHLKNWGLKLSPNLVQLEGRVLEPEINCKLDEELCNCKLGGELWAFKNMMVVRVDVNRDLIVSMNQTVSSWHLYPCQQMPGEELIDALKNAFMEGLRKYYETNHSWPDTVVIFRYGINDSQLSVAAKHEAQQFKDCFKNIGGNYSPGLGFVMVQKRIMTRIFKDCENPAPGTVLDHTITKRDWHNFFLVSQKVGQDTVSLSHYIVVDDSSGLSPDMMQKLAYKLTQDTIVFYQGFASQSIPLLGVQA